MIGGGWIPRIWVAVVGLSLTTCMQSEDAAGTESTEYFAPASPPTDALARLMDRTFVPGRRIGLLEAGMPMAAVENLYGSTEIEESELPAGEGTMVPGYVMFPGTRDEFFVELGPDHQPARVRIVEARSRWRDTEYGLTIGTSLRDLQTMNDGPFEFAGFGWDYGGIVTDWLGGRLEGLDVRLLYAAERVGRDFPRDSLLGNRTLQSDEEALGNLGIEVREISFSLERPQSR
jgi:hypothetical protein